MTLEAELAHPRFAQSGADARNEISHRLWSTVEGSPVPQGVTRVEEEGAYNFALYSKHATAVTLLLYREDDLVQPQSSHRLDHRQHKTGRVWHCRIPYSVAENCHHYAYSLEGESAGDGDGWQRFDPAKVLFDPYAREIFFPDGFDRSAAIHPGSNAGRAPLGVLPGTGENTRDRSDTRPPRHEGEAVIYELHVDAFTRSESSGVAPNRRGTFLGLMRAEAGTSRVHSGTMRTGVVASWMIFAEVSLRSHCSIVERGPLPTTMRLAFRCSANSAIVRAGDPTSIEIFTSAEGSISAT
jgi:hypothetical protein